MKTLFEELTTHFWSWSLWALWERCGTKASPRARRTNTCWWSLPALGRTAHLVVPFAYKSALSVWGETVFSCQIQTLDERNSPVQFVVVGSEISTYLRQCAATHGEITVVADLKQCDTKAPLVWCITSECTIVNTLRGDPWDTFQTLCSEIEKWL